MQITRLWQCDCRVVYMCPCSCNVQPWSDLFLRKALESDPPQCHGPLAEYSVGCEQIPRLFFEEESAIGSHQLMAFRGRSEVAKRVNGVEAALNWPQIIFGPLERL